MIENVIWISLKFKEERVGDFLGLVDDIALRRRLMDFDEIQYGEISSMKTLTIFNEKSS
jgi:hypothetical protein